MTVPAKRPAPVPVTRLPAQRLSADPAAPAAGRTLDGLTAARWWAALAVFLLHALVFLPAYPFQKSELFRRIHQDFMPMQLGAAGVTFFFVLSGFIIHWSFRPGTTKTSFYRRRVLKIYPTHLIAAAVFILAAAVPLSRSVVWAPNLLLLHTWIPKWSTVGGLNVPSWSLVAEMLFYLAYPFARPMVQRIRPDRLPHWIVGLLIFIILLHTAYFLGFAGPTDTTNAFAPRLVPGDVSPFTELHASQAWFAQPDIPVIQAYWFGYTFPLSRLPEFFVGVLAARMVIENRWRNTKLTVPTTAVAVSYLATWVVPVNYKMSALMVGPMAALVATIAVRDLRHHSERGAYGPLVWLGNVSYAFYLIQYPVMVIITRLVIGGRQFGFAGWLGCALFCFALSLMASSAIYHWVDQPLMRRFAHRSAGQRSPAPRSGDRRSAE